MGENGVMRTKNHPPPVPWESPKSFFGNRGGYSIRANKTKKALLLSPRFLFFCLWLIHPASTPPVGIASTSVTVRSATTSSASLAS